MERSAGNSVTPRNRLIVTLVTGNKQGKQVLNVGTLLAWKLVAIPQAAVVLSAAVGDATIGAIIAGIFLLFNTLLTWIITRHDRRPPPKKRQKSNNHPRGNRPDRRRGPRV